MDETPSLNGRVGLVVDHGVAPAVVVRIPGLRNVTVKIQNLR